MFIYAQIRSSHDFIDKAYRELGRHGLEMKKKKKRVPRKKVRETLRWTVLTVPHQSHSEISVQNVRPCHDSDLPVTFGGVCAGGGDDKASARQLAV